MDEKLRELWEKEIDERPTHMETRDEQERLTSFSC
jgi:hypothetical protein